jgi:hypothetical protein
LALAGIRVRKNFLQRGQCGEAARHRLPGGVGQRYAIWQGFNNQYWPADYFTDAKGRIRHHYYGEGGYKEGGDVTRALLTAAGQNNLPGGYVEPDAKGAGAASSGDYARSPETCVGYARADDFAGDDLAPDAYATIKLPRHSPSTSGRSTAAGWCTRTPPRWISSAAASASASRAAACIWCLAPPAMASPCASGSRWMEKRRVPTTGWTLMPGVTAP